MGGPKLISENTAQTVIEAFIQTWVCRFGVPRVVVTDNANYFYRKTNGTVAIRLIRFCSPASNALPPPGEMHQ